MTPLRIFTPAWGEKHLNLLENALGKTLRWPRNYEAIKHARWNIMCHVSEREPVMEIATKILPREQIDLLEFGVEIHQLTASRGIIMNEALIRIVALCIQEKAQMLMSTPDFLWGDGTIEKMIKSAEGRPRVCVPIMHPRVLPQIMEELGAPLNNFELATKAMKYPHSSWVSSEDGASPSGTRIGGIRWMRVKKGVISVQHRMPSPYLVNFTFDDYKFFQIDTPEKRAAFGAWDHDWSCELLKQGRIRQMQGSDAGFMAEVTSPECNVPPMGPYNASEPDIFWHEDYNHQINRQFVSCFRYGED